MPNYYKPWNAATDEAFDDNKISTNALASEDLDIDASDLTSTSEDHTSNKEPWTSGSPLKTNR